MMSSFILLLYIYDSMGFGYDSGADQSTCGRPYRSGRVYVPPCNLEKESYCITAGKAYPWRAVKRFVTDNQGLMRRMYGDQNHEQILKAELDNNVDLWGGIPLSLSRYYRGYDEDLTSRNSVDNSDDNEARLLKEKVGNEDFFNTKFVYSDEPVSSNKLNDFRTDSISKTTLQQASEVEQTTTEPVTVFNSGLNTPLDTTTEQTTTDVTDVVTSKDFNATTTARIDLVDKKVSEENDAVKVDTMLFQDADDVKKKKPINYNTRGINACPVKEEVVAPFWANNTRGEVLALLNMYPFEQYVHWEKCTFENRQMYCREGCRCEQQYRLHRLLAYDPNNECRGIFSDWFRFPSCCVCKCYDMPLEFRVTSRSPRSRQGFSDL